MPRTKPKTRRAPANSAAAPSVARAAAKSSHVLTLAETAAHLRVTEEDILDLVREQRLPGRKVGRGWRFLKTAVESWLATSTATDQAQFWQTHFGALHDDPQLGEIVREAYRKRGRPDDGAP